MHTCPRQSIGTGHQQVHAAVPHCAFPRKCGLVHSLEPPSSGLGHVNCRALPTDTSLTLPCLSRTCYSLCPQVDLRPEAATSVAKHSEPRTCHTECPSLMAAGIKSVFQGKLCFPPLPSTVFYRTMSSFIPLSTGICHTNCIRALSALPSLHSLLHGALVPSATLTALQVALKPLSFCPHHGWVLKLLTSLTSRLVQRKLYPEVCNLTKLREPCKAHSSTSASSLE